MSNEDFEDEFGGFEEAQPSTLATNSLKSDSIINIEQNNKTPEWLLETFTKATPTIQTHSNSSSSSLEDQLKRAFNLIQNQQENYQNLQKQFEILRLTNIQMNKELETSLKNSNIKHIKSLNEENEKLLEQKLQARIDKTIQKMNNDIDERFERKLASTQEQLIKHYESENEVLEIRLNKLFKNQIDEEISVKLKQSIEIVLKEQKLEVEKLLKQQFNSLNDCFKDQIKSNIDQETLILKDIVNKKLDFLIKNYENKTKRTNHLYSRQLTNLSSFLDNAKIQIDLMQNHIKKQTDSVVASNRKDSKAKVSDEEEDDDDDNNVEEDETLLNI